MLNYDEISGKICVTGIDWEMGVRSAVNSILDVSGKAVCMN
jgi:hypothetical protein